MVVVSLLMVGCLVAPTALRNAILEICSVEWVRKQFRYLDDWQRQGMTELQLMTTLPVAADPMPFSGAPSAYSLVDVRICKVILSQLPQLLATCTTIR